MYSVNLYYDSGHHYYFYPLSTSTECSEEQIDAIKSFYELENLGKFDPDLSTQWFVAKKKEWLRARVTNKIVYYNAATGNNKVKIDCLNKSECDTIELKGLLLCIETTTGSSKDGLFESSQDCVSDQHEDINCYISEQPPAEKKQILNLYELFEDTIFHVSKDSADNNKTNSLMINITFKNAVDNTAPVSLHVDFGNSRTIALRFDKTMSLPNADDHLAYQTRGIYLSDDFKEFYLGSNTKSIERDIFHKEFLVDSWITLMEPTFNKIDLKNEHYENIGRPSKNFFDKILKRLFSTKNDTKLFIVKPLMFNENSFVHFTMRPPLNFNNLVNFYLSSPKRYILDNTSERSWKMLSTDSEGKITFKTLSGDYMILRNIKDLSQISNDDIKNVKDGKDGNTEARLSRKELMILSALKIIETSNKQLSNEYYGFGGDGKKRYLKDIYITYPSGWTQQEKHEYQKIWERAKNLFLFSKYSHNLKEHDIGIHIDMDEAVSSSMPIIFSEIYNINNKVNNFFELYGSGEAVRVLSLDIGGGTQDIAIIDYTTNSEKKEIDLSAVVIFADSNRKAGDDLIRRLIKNILLPYIGKKEDSTNDYEAFLECIDGPGNIAAFTIYYNIIKREVFIPIIQSWLQDFNIESYKETKGSTNKKFIEYEKLVQNSIDALKESFGNIYDGACDQFKECFDSTNKIDISYSEIEQEIKCWAEETLLDFILLYEAFDCDLLIVSGKVSELKPIQETIKQYFSASLNEIIFTKNYYAGDWMPISNNKNTILDSKLTTVTGSLLTKAISSGSFGDGWNSINISTRSSNIKYYWYIKESISNYERILAPNEDKYDYSVSQQGRAREIAIGRSFYEGGNIQKMYTLKIPEGWNGNITIKRENELKLLKNENEQDRRIRDREGRARRGQNTSNQAEDMNNDYYDALTLTQSNRQSHGADDVQLILDTLEIGKDSYYLDYFKFKDNSSRGV